MASDNASSAFFRRWAWLPLPFLLLTIAILWAANLQTQYESPALLMVLNIVTRTLPCLAIVYVVGRSFLDAGAPGLLLVGCGTLIWGAAGFIANTAAVGRDANLGMTINNLGAWLSALCQLAGVALSIQVKRVVRTPQLWLSAAYGLALGIMVLVAAGTFAGWLPVFFTQDQGGTTVREFVLCSAIAMFMLAAFLLRAENRSTSFAFAQWYAWALFLIATGLLGMLFESSRNTALDWAGRMAQCLGGVYMLAAALASGALRRRARTVTVGEAPRESHRYAMAIGIVLAAAAVRLAFLQMLGTRATYVTFYPAVMLAALYGGLGPGLLATGLSALLSDYLWLEPAGQLFIRNYADLVGLAIFTVSCTLMSFITEALRRAQARAREAEVRAQYDGDHGRALQALHESEQQFMLKKLKLVFPVQMAFAAALVILTAITWFSYRNTMSMVESDRWEDHCYVVVQELDRFVSALADAETAQRGFLMTGEEKYLAPYNLALQKAGERLASLKHLTQADSGSQARLQEIEPLLNQELAVLEQNIGLRRMSGVAASFPPQALDRGKALMDQTRARVVAFQQNEAQLLQTHMAEKIADTRSVLQTVVVGGFLSFGLLVAVFVLLRKEVAQRIRAESEVLAHRDHLEEKVQARTAELEREVSERKRAEVALRHERDFSTAVLDTAGALIVVFDVEGRITQFNRACEALTGHREIEVLGRVFWEFLIPSEDLLGVCEMWSALQAGVFANTHENYWLAKDGSRHLIAWSNTAIVSSTGAIEYIIGTGVDITERNRAENALRQSETKHRIVADNTYDWEFWRDPQGQFLYCSPSCERVTGHLASEFMADGDLRHRLIHPGDREAFDHHCCQIEEQRKFGEAEWRFLLPDGTVRWIAHVCQPVYDASGNFLGTRGSNRDITERKLAEDALRRHNAIQTGINQILRAALTCETEEQLGNVCLEIAERVTQSQFGFIGEINDDGLQDIAISNPGSEACQVVDPGGQRQPRGNFKIHGIYGRVLLSGKSLFTNDPPHHPDSIGLPQGHLPLRAFLGVPLIREGQTIGMIAVGNRDGGYTQTEQDALEALMPAMVEAFMRKRTEEALEATRHSLERERDLLQTVMNEAKKSHLVFLDRDFNFVRVNETYARTCGYSPQQMIGKNHFALYPDAENEAIFARVRDTGAPAEYHDKPFEFPDQPERGVTYWDWTLNPVKDSDGQVVGLIFSLFETTGRKRAEEALLRAQAELEVRVQERTGELQASNTLLQAAIRGWRTLSACNEALVRATSETELLEQICRVIVDFGGYRMAWVGFAEHDQKKTVRPAAKRGFDDGYLDKVNITWDDSPQGRGPTGTAIREGQIVVNRNFMTDPHLSPWRNDAIKHGYASSVALPLLSDGSCLGALTIYATEPEAFSTGELDLLRELASNMSFGIITLRTRAERERLQVEILRVSEREQQRIGQDLHDNLGQQLTGIAYLSEALERRLSTRAPAEAASASRIAKLLGAAIGEARSLAHGLNPLHLQGNGLMLSLLELARRMNSPDHVSCRFICHKPVLVHDDTVALHLFRIVQEAVNNALKHGRARHVTIHLEDGPSTGRAMLYVQDDGCGLPKKPKKTRGIGLATMKHRAVAIGGILEIRAAEPRGTIVECSFSNSASCPQPEPTAVKTVRAENRTKSRREFFLPPAAQQTPTTFKPLGRRTP